jgi:hypothetical protein
MRFCEPAGPYGSRCAGRAPGSVRTTVLSSLILLHARGVRLTSSLVPNVRGGWPASRSTFDAPSPPGLPVEPRNGEGRLGLPRAAFNDVVTSLKSALGEKLRGTAKAARDRRHRRNGAPAIVRAEEAIRGAWQPTGLESSQDRVRPHTRMPGRFRLLGFGYGTSR